MELADDVIGWVGGIGKSSIGRDSEGKINQMFMAGGRFGSSTVDRVARGPEKKPRTTPKPSGKAAAT
jgi:hypothetical protein